MLTSTFRGMFQGLMYALKGLRLCDRCAGADPAKHSGMQLRACGSFDAP